VTGTGSPRAAAGPGALGRGRHCQAAGPCCSLCSIQAPCVPAVRPPAADRSRTGRLGRSPWPSLRKPGRVSTGPAFDSGSTVKRLETPPPQPQRRLRSAPSLPAHRDCSKCAGLRVCHSTPCHPRGDRRIFCSLIKSVSPGPAVRLRLSARARLCVSSDQAVLQSIVRSVCQCLCLPISSSPSFRHCLLTHAPSLPSPGPRSFK
jgi:hypothetical protein